MSQIKLCLDTNILHQEGLSSQRMKILKKLIDNSKVSLIIPEIFVKEYASKLLEFAEDDIQKIDKSIRSLQKRDILKKFTSAYEATHSAIIRPEMQALESKVKHWLIDYSVDVFSMSNTSVTSLFESYFTGSGAFKEKKRREDIPDAMVYDAVAQLSRKGELCVAIKDDHLKQKIETLPNIQCYKSLDEFLIREDIKAALRNIDNKDSKIDEMLRYMEKYDFLLRIEEYFSNSNMYGIDRAYYDSSVILPYELRNLQCEDLEVRAIEPYQDKKISIFNAVYLGKLRFSASGEIASKVNLTITCHMEELEELPGRTRKKLTHISSTEEHVTVRGIFDAKYEAIIELDNINYEDHDINTIDENLAYLSSDHSPYTIVVSIEKVLLDE